MNHPIIQQAVELNDPDLAKEALQEIEALLRASSDPEDRLYLLFSRASCHEILGDFEGARVHLTLALRERPDESSQTTFDFMQALFCQREEKNAEALERFTTVLTVHLEELKRAELYEDVQTRRAFLSVTLNKFQDAIPLLKETLSFDLSKQLRSEVLAWLGLCYLELKEYEPSRDSFLESFELGLVKDWKWQGHFYLGIAYYHTDMLLEAKREFQQCEELAGMHPLPIIDVYGWLSNTCKRIGDVSEAARYATLGKRN
jgi:tetratricopeptide (TPR) repeat protein